MELNHKITTTKDKEEKLLHIALDGLDQLIKPPHDLYKRQHQNSNILNMFFDNEMGIMTKSIRLESFDNCTYSFISKPTFPSEEYQEHYDPIILSENILSLLSENCPIKYECIFQDVKDNEYVYTQVYKSGECLYKASEKRHNGVEHILALDSKQDVNKLNESYKIFENMRSEAKAKSLPF